MSLFCMDQQQDLVRREMQAFLGRQLRAAYDLSQPLPERLNALLRQLEQRERETCVSGGTQT